MLVAAEVVVEVGVRSVPRPLSVLRVLRVPKVPSVPTVPTVLSVLRVFVLFFGFEMLEEVAEVEMVAVTSRGGVDVVPSFAGVKLVRSGVLMVAPAVAIRVPEA